MNLQDGSCKCCQSSGRIVCWSCNGVGARMVMVRGREEWNECSECLGAKTTPCPECDGTGKRIETHRWVA